jgi:hypothetical protein
MQMLMHKKRGPLINADDMGHGDKPWGLPVPQQACVSVMIEARIYY